MGAVFVLLNLPGGNTKQGRVVQRTRALGFYPGNLSSILSAPSNSVLGYLHEPHDSSSRVRVSPL